MTSSEASVFRTEGEPRVSRAGSALGTRSPTERGRSTMTGDPASNACRVCGARRDADGPCPECGDDLTPAPDARARDQDRFAVEAMAGDTSPAMYGAAPDVRAYFEAGVATDDQDPEPTPAGRPAPGANRPSGDLGVEVSSWLESRPVLRWDAPRMRLAAYCLVTPAVVSIAVGLFAALRAGGALDVALAITAFVLVLTVPVIADYALFALFGGGLSATPRGLAFRFNVRANRVIPWSTIASVGVEARMGGYRWLVIGLTTDGPSWPWSLTLVGTTGDHLRISPLLLPRSVDIVAAEVAAAVEAAVAGDVERAPS